MEIENDRFKESESCTENPNWWVHQRENDTILGVLNISVRSGFPARCQSCGVFWHRCCCSSAHWKSPRFGVFLTGRITLRHAGLSHPPASGRDVSRLPNKRSQGSADRRAMLDFVWLDMEDGECYYRLEVGCQNSRNSHGGWTEHNPMRPGDAFQRFMCFIQLLPLWLMGK